MSSVLLRGLVDDAALFPPGDAPMGLAVATHRAIRVGPLERLVRRFLCPASRIGHLAAHLRAEDRFVIGLIADTGLAGLPTAVARVRSDPRFRLDAVEVALAADADLVSGARAALLVLPSDTTAYVELPRVAGWQAAVATLAQAGRGAKLRTGGPTARAFPSEREVADFLLACRAGPVPFKCSAGLHRAVRHTDPVSGFEHHGFLNILLATCAVVRGEDPLPVLAERDPAVLVAAYGAVGSDTAIRARALFAGFGTCSVVEPAEDLLALGILEEAA